ARRSWPLLERHPEAIERETVSGDPGEESVDLLPTTLADQVEQRGGEELPQDVRPAGVGRESLPHGAEDRHEGPVLWAQPGLELAPETSRQAGARPTRSDRDLKLPARDDGGRDEPRGLRRVDDVQQDPLPLGLRAEAADQSGVTGRRIAEQRTGQVTVPVGASDVAEMPGGQLGGELG